MSNVRSEPIRSARSSGAGIISIVGMGLLLISMGPLFILLNGGYSIIGMSWVAAHTGPYGRLFWELATTWTINAPIAERAGLPLSQPIVPWCMVLGISFLEVGLLIRRFYRGRVDVVLDTSGGAASLFDYSTTAIGLVFAPFVVDVALVYRVIWAIFALMLAVPLTFGFEALVARLLASIMGKGDKV